MGTPDPGLSEAGGTGVGGEEAAAMGTPDPGLSEAGGTGAVAKPSLSNDGNETPLAPADDGMQSPLLQGSPSDVDIAPPSPAFEPSPAEPSAIQGPSPEPSAIDVLGIGRGPSPPRSPAGSATATPVQTPAAPEPSVIDILGGIGRGPSPPRSPAGSAPATLVQAPAAPEPPKQQVRPRSPSPAVVASPSSPSPVPENVEAPPVPLAPPVPDPNWVFPYRRHRAGIAGVDFAASGNSICRACNKKIAFKSVRFQYYFVKNRPPGYLHADCVATLPDQLELIEDLDYLQPDIDELMAARSTAKEALQRAIPVD